MKNLINGFAIITLFLVIIFTGCQMEENPLQETESDINSNVSKGNTYVTLYPHKNYGYGDGLKVNYGVDIPDLSVLGIENEISSIKVANYAKVRLYDHSDYKGINMFIFEDVPDLKKYGYNDKFSSLKWYQPNCIDFAILYEHENYQGRNAVLFKGELLFDLGHEFYRLNDEVSSIRFYALPWEIECFPHKYWRGFPLKVNDDIPKLRYYDFNDMMGSVKAN